MAQGVHPQDVSDAIMGLTQAERAVVTAAMDHILSIGLEAWRSQYVAKHPEVLDVPAEIG